MVDPIRYGVLKEPDVTFSGEWDDGKMHGHGKIECEDGNCFEGKWSSVLGCLTIETR